MFDAFIGSVFMFLTLLGTVAICYFVMLKLLIPKIKGTYYVVLPCNQNTQNVRSKAYGMRIRLNLLSGDCNGKVVMLDSGIAEREKEDLLSICKECNGIYLVNKDYIKDYFDGRV